MTEHARRNTEYPCLNAMRALASAGVVATHAAFWTAEINVGLSGAVLARLDVAVAMFFVLSGFLISRPFLAAMAARKPQPGLGTYLWKRSLRILPTYWIAVVAALTLLEENRGSSLSVWWHNLTLTQIYTEAPQREGLTQMWSLCTEVAFYVCLPLICVAFAWLLCRGAYRPGRIAVALAAMSMAGLIWLWVVTPHFISSFGYPALWLPSYLTWFSVGMLFALATVTMAGHPETAKPGWQAFERLGGDLFGCWTAAAALLLLASTPVAGPLNLEELTQIEAVTKNVLYAAIACLVLAPLIFGPRREGIVRTVLAHRVFWWLGEVAYGVFCFHLVLLALIHEFLGIEIFTGGFLMIFTTTWVSAVVVSAVVYYLVERPMSRLRTIRLPRRKAATPTQPKATSTSS